MAKEIFDDYNKFMQKSYKMVSLGIKPSGSPHIGSIATLTAAFDYAADHPDAKINLQIMDLDYDSRRGKNFVPFIHRKDVSGRSVREEMREDLDQIVDFMDGIYKKNVKDRVQIDFFSEFFLMPDSLEKFLSVFTSEHQTESLNSALFNSPLYGKLPVSGICPNCHTSSSALAERVIRKSVYNGLVARLEDLRQNKFDLSDENLKKAIEVTEKKIFSYDTTSEAIYTYSGGGPEYFARSKCTNMGCSVVSYDFDLRKGFYNVHYLVDPLRDEVLDPTGNSVHIFGGDYAKPHGKTHLSKAELIRNGLEATCGMNQDFFIGPLITCCGDKMGKSGVAVPFNSIPADKQRLLVEHIHELYVKGCKEMDYEVIASKL